MHFGTLDGLISNLFTTVPMALSIVGVVYLARKGFFGPNSR